MTDDELNDSFLARVAHSPEVDRGRGFLPKTLIGEVLDGRFRLLELIGHGGMGFVFRAIQQTVNREVAVKILRPLLAQDDQSVARFESEARIIADLRHPNVVRLIDFGRTADGLFYMVTELLRGVPLRHRIGERAWSEDQVVWLIKEICDTLIEAHRKGIIHRDLKPSNIFIEPVEGRELVKVLDFGVAKLVAAPTATRDGSIIGTPLYMSPEQASGAPVDARSDLYSLGVVAFECLARRPPFTGETADAVLHQHRHQPPPQLESVVGATQVSPELRRLIEQLLQKSPERRPPSAAAVRSATSGGAKESAFLEEPSMGFADTVSSERRRGERTPRSRTWDTPRGVALGVAVVVLALIAVVSIRVELLPITEVAKRYADSSGQRAMDSNRPPSAREVSGRQTIAVLPFEDLSPTRDQAYFARGVADGILTALGRTQGLRVPSRTSSFAFKDRGLSVRKIAEELRVAHLLEGSVLKAGGRVRVAAQLVETDTDTTIWSETYQRPLTVANLLAIQDEVVAAIVSALKGELTVTPETPGQALSLAAYELYLHGREDMYMREKSSLPSAEARLRELVGLAQDFSPGYAALAEILVRRAGNAKAVEAPSLLARALDLDPLSAEAITVQARIEYKRNNMHKSLELARKAISINPNFPEAYNRASQTLMFLGRMPEALEMSKSALRLDPLSLRYGRQLAYVYVQLNRIAEARGAAENIIRLHPRSSRGYLALHYVNIASARYAEAYANIQDYFAYTSTKAQQGRNFKSDIGVANWTITDPDIAKTYLRVRDGGALGSFKLDRYGGGYGVMFCLLARDLPRARETLRGFFAKYYGPQHVITDDGAARMYLWMEFLDRELGFEQPFVRTALDDYFRRELPGVTDVGNALISLAWYNILRGRTQQAYEHIDRAQDLGFAGDDLRFPIFDRLRDTPEFAKRVERNRLLVEKHHAEIDQLIANPKPHWIQPLYRVSTWP